ncbi:PREDICTED: uncharacterized protein LOC109152301 [Ipomoea nil]|uniref:uncharacterized protein LOC109152301 n=1 Tax=Ipomoea nil TaxID=35883 RepID=UPI000900BB29|nr:PREDICTED: uncharacterized protein LOC109152301 [Ipomoea nil]
MMIGLGRKEEEESALHIFATCPEAMRAYHAVGLPITYVPGNVVHEWFFGCLSMLRADLIPKFIMVCWGIWCSRNACVWRGAAFDLMLMVHHALLFLDNWLAGNESTILPAVPSRQVERWNKSQAGRLKLNTDAAINQTSNTMGYGWVVRDDNRLFLAAKSMSVPGIYDVKVAEAMSMREALSWFKNTGMGGVDVETDSHAAPV